MNCVFTFWYSVTHGGLMSLKNLRHSSDNVTIVSVYFSLTEQLCSDS